MTGLPLPRELPELVDEERLLLRSKVLYMQERNEHQDQTPFQTPFQ